MLITGGGSHNTFLVERIKHHVQDSRVQFCSPPELVDFKEAIVFAFLGVRRLVGLPNVARQATGAAADSVSGAIHFGSAVDEQQ
jgi:anhydro-N-acetylmuramic acid kinase